jgi:hypothetical protein
MPLFDDPVHWRARAEEIRRLGLATPERDTRVLLEIVAKSYDALPIARRCAWAQRPTKLGHSVQ